MHQHPPPVFVSVLQLAVSACPWAARAHHDEKEVHGRAEPNNQGINRGHDGVAPRKKGSLAEFAPRPACADARRREVKAQPQGRCQDHEEDRGEALPASKTAPKRPPRPSSPLPRRRRLKTPARTAVKAVAKAPARGGQARPPRPGEDSCQGRSGQGGQARGEGRAQGRQDDGRQGGRRGGEGGGHGRQGSRRRRQENPCQGQPGSRKGRAAKAAKPPRGTRTRRSEGRPPGPRKPRRPAPARRGPARSHRSSARPPLRVPPRQAISPWPPNPY
jgi:hypothetical protein